ncbi:minor capsid protein [Streptococcus suis]
MSFDMKITVDLKGIEKKVSPQAFDRGRLAMTNQMLLDMNKYVPARSESLRNSGRASKDSVIWSAPYARLRFYGKKQKGFFSDRQRKFFFANKEKLLQHKKRPGTGPRWDKKAIPIHMKQWEQVALKGMGL